MKFEDYFHRGIAKVQKGDHDGAIEDFNVAIKLNPNHADAYLNRGIAKVQKGDHDGAIEDINEAIRLNPKSPDAYLNRGTAKGQKGDHAGAIEDFSEAIRLEPNHTNAYYNRGIAKGKKGDHDDAIEDFNEIIRQNPKNPDAYLYRGTAKGRKGDYDGAIEDFNVAIKLNPNHASAYYNSGVAKGRKEDYDGAIKDFSEAIRLEPNHAEAYRNRGFAKERKKNYDGAIEDLDKAIQLNPKNAFAHHDRGIAKGGKGKHNDAIEDLNEAIRQNPKYVNAYHNRGITKWEKGDHDKAIEDFNKAAAIDPDFPSMHVYAAKETAGKDMHVRKKFHALVSLIFDILKNWSEEEWPSDPMPMHYTSCEVVQLLAEGKRFRLYDAATMDDLKEGTAIFDLFEGAENAIEPLKKAKSNGLVFIGSFVTDSDNNNGDSLMWGQYGKDSTGSALVFEPDTFSSKKTNIALLGPRMQMVDDSKENVSQLAKNNPVTKEALVLYKVHYIGDKIPKTISSRLDILKKHLNELLELGTEMDEKLWSLAKTLLDMVRFLFKGKVFSREQEARIVVWRSKLDKIVCDEVPRKYVECPVDFRSSRILLGPRLKHPQGWAEYLKKQAKSGKITEDIEVAEL